MGYTTKKMIKINGGRDHWWQLEFDMRSTPPFLEWTFHHHEFKIMSMNAAIDYTAKVIADKFDNIYLLMSGGLDSEFVAECLRRNSVPFTPIIGYVAESNNQDYFYAMRWCEQHKVEPVCIEFDLDDTRLTKACVDFIKRFGFKSESFFLKPLMDYVIALGGHVLTGEPALTHEVRGSRWSDSIGEIFDIANFSFVASIYTNGSHPGEFCAYTPELMYALIRDTDTNTNNALSKSKLYNIPFRPKTWPFTVFTDKTQSNIHKICNANDLPNSVYKAWSKQELLTLLSTPQKNCY